jgi:EAL domain-containing protein (putative c-di-GMP-specific phosphodiesterase class I)
MSVFSRFGGPKKERAEVATANASMEAFLRAARKHFGMDVAFIGEFTMGRRVFRHVNSDEADCAVVESGGDRLEDSYCQRVIDGRLPELIIDPKDFPAAMELEATRTVPVGSHLSVPIRLRNGEIFGTFCCFSHTTNPALGPADIDKMHVFAHMVSAELEVILQNRARQSETAARVQQVLDARSLRILYQPIFRLWQNEIMGFECLSRFPAPPPRRPDVWFADADEVGLGQTLEVSAIELGLRALPLLPAPLDVRINASPALVLSGALGAALEGHEFARIVLEVTEHEPVNDYEAFLAMLSPLRQQGMRLAVDDAGAGHATLRHILKLQPDIIKLDISLIRDIDSDRYKSALAAALIRFALETEAEIVAEGIETSAEMTQLRALGAQGGQGNYLGRPVALEEALALVAERGVLDSAV